MNRDRINRVSAVAVSAASLLAGMFATLASVSASAEVTPAPTEAIAVAPIVNRPQAWSENYYKFPTAMVKLIDATPSGQTIRWASYSFSLTDLSDALIRAHKRGVNVQVIVDEHAATGAFKALVKELGKSTTAKSFAFQPTEGGIARDGGIMHAKMVTVSAAGNQRYITVVGSGNSTMEAAAGSWNEQSVMVGHQTLYDGLNAYFAAIAANKAQPNYNKSVSSGSMTMYFFPGVPFVVRDALAKVDPTKPGCKIDVMMYRWLDSMKTDASKLVDLANKGCAVRVVVNENADELDASVEKILRSSSKIQVHDGDVPDHGYVHAKTWIINGTVYGGSVNQFVSSYTRDAEILTKRTSADTEGKYNLDRYNEFMENLWVHTSKM